MKHFTDFHNETFSSVHGAKERLTNFNRAKEGLQTSKGLGMPLLVKLLYDPVQNHKPTELQFST